MKLIYFAMFFFGISAVSAQDLVDLGSANLETFSFKLYPNPVHDDVVYIQTRTNASKFVVVYDVFGEIVLTERLVTDALSVSRLVPGVYVLQVTENEKTTSRKLVVK